MKAIVKTAPGPGNIEVRDHELQTTAPGQAELEILACGVCGSDLKMISGDYECVPPLVLGHEISGRVVDVGSDADSAWIGKRVVSETYFSTCGGCAWCTTGRPNLCPERRSIGTHVDGGFATRIVVPISNLHPVPDWLDEHAATLFEPLACVTHSFRDPSAVTAGDRVAVIGPGPMGALSAQVALARGGEVVVVGLPSDEQRFEVIRRLGIETSTELVKEDFDVVVDTSGSQGGLEAALTAVRRGGRLIQIGIVGRAITADFDLVLVKEIDIHTGFASTPRSWSEALDLVSNRKVELEPLISEVIGLTEWERAFADLKQSRGMKIVIDPRKSTNADARSLEDTL